MPQPTPMDAPASPPLLNRPATAICISLLATLVVALLFAGSLVRRGASGIAYTHYVEAGTPPVAMVAGDHLQLLYHFWLLRDSLSGQTPFRANPYEFNVGANQPDGRISGAYYAPFGPLFALLEPAVGLAAAWNLTAWISLWISYLATFILVRRYVRNAGIAVVGAAPALLLPFLWIALMGGSPTGFGMLWPPVVMLGIDVAIRDKKPAWAALAGAGIAASMWSDTHVFFFTFLAIPFWSLVSLAKSLAEGAPATLAHKARDGFRRLLGLWPVALGMGVAMAASLLISRSLEDSVMDAGWNIGALLPFSPTYHGWWGWNTLTGYTSQIYLGRVLAAVVLAGFAVLAWRAVRRRERSAWDWILFGMLLAATAAIAVSALGPRVPFDPNHLVLRITRKLIPPYQMIRQTAKVYGILPPILSLLFAIALDRVAGPLRPRTQTAVLLLVAALVMVDYGRRIRPGVCLLDPDQGAYAAVAEDAEALGRERRAMAIPLWLGDSHWSSLYLYYGSMHRIRMPNGYSPAAGRDYVETFFKTFSPLNAGFADDARLDDLLRRGIGYLLFHEDAFPEKVSPFPAFGTLDAFLRHPRLTLLGRDRSAWAFRIESAPYGKSRQPTGKPVYLFPTRFWEAEKIVHENAEPIAEDPTASRGAFARVGSPGAILLTAPLPAQYRSQLHYAVRLRGPLPSHARVLHAGPVSNIRLLAGPDAQGWIWAQFDVPPFDGYLPIQLEVQIDEAPLDVDLVILGAGDCPFPAPGQTVRLPAAAFFRAGHSDPDSGAVTIERERVQEIAFYGPNHPLPDGVYEFELHFHSAAPEGTLLGRLVQIHPTGVEAFDVPVLAGQSCRFTYRHAGNLTFGMLFRFARRADLVLEAVSIARQP
jgi:hypothetical protein